ncbi:MAG: ribose-phosphate pyrophosphokinase [Myxococcales bacterium]|nr:ribose-phosphate pyrophosphokinase [Myxococcales bacterium]MBK7198744.1 ribose-phosphate pyrophosphokinase [Myxococcales bacterium]
MAPPRAIFIGTATPALGAAICTTLGVAPARARLDRFSDGEVHVELDDSVRGARCFVVQSTCAPVSDTLLELLVMVDALRRSSAGSIVAIMPYFGFARQDLKARPRTPISAKLCANLLTAAGVDRVLSVDLHTGQLQGFFDIPVDHLFSKTVLVDELRHLGLGGPGTVVVAPDAGGVERARAYAKRLDAPLAIVDQAHAGAGRALGVVGDVRGAAAIIVDDIVDTAETLTTAAHALIQAGAASVVACVTHPVLSPGAVARIDASPLAAVVVTDTIPLGPDARACAKLRTRSMAPLIAEAIRRIHRDDSISSLFV